MGICEHNDSKFAYEDIEMVCPICGFVNCSNRDVMNGNIIDLDYVMSISLEKPGNQETIDEYDLDAILIRYKKEKEGNKPASIWRAADCTASGRMDTMISNTKREFAGNNIIKQYKQAERMRMILIVCVMNLYSTVMTVKSLDLDAW